MSLDGYAHDKSLLSGVSDETHRSPLSDETHPAGFLPSCISFSGPLFLRYNGVFFRFAFAFSEKHGILYMFYVFHGLVAQSVEHRPFKAVVQGSSPCQLTLFSAASGGLFREPLFCFFDARRHENGVQAGA